MKTHTLLNLCDLALKFAFAGLFLLVPLTFYKANYELFEYNKMMATYALATIAVFAWLAKMVLSRQIFIAKTILDIPIFLFLISQFLSFFFSIDPHVSFWGYYSRANGGLLSTIIYILLYYAFVSNVREMKDEQWTVASTSGKLILASLLTGFVISLYAIFEHFGHSFSCLIITGSFDVACWVQDVQARVYATLGQPNWLAAYLAVLIPLAIGLGLSFLKRRNDLDGKTQNNNTNIINLLILAACYLLPTIYYLALLFTKSRSGFLGVWAGLVVFVGLGVLYWLLSIVFTDRKRHKALPRQILFTILGLVVITFIVRSPFEKINRFFSPEALYSILRINHQTVTNPANSPLAANPSTPALESGGTESGEIRKYVWQGAIDAFFARPLFGWGVETFAWVYYRFKPSAHNLTSEWDFLYNKAHNEYLNYAATSGIFGLGSHLLIIFVFGIWLLVKLIKEARDKRQTNFLLIGLFTGWCSILVTDFFGFSVVVTSLFFWLIPAFSLVLTQNSRIIHIGLPFLPQVVPPDPETKPTVVQMAGILLVSIAMISVLFSLTARWIADTHFAAGYALSRQKEYTGAYSEFARALALNFSEPLYHDEFATTLASLAVVASDTKEATLAARLTHLAIASSDKAITISGQNVSFWKSRARVFYTLAQLDKKYDHDALETIEIAETLAPTDPKVVYNRALLLSRLKRQTEAFVALEKAIKLKPDYRDTRFALAVFYHEAGEDTKAKEELHTILKIVGPDEEVQKMLEELNKK